MPTVGIEADLSESLELIGKVENLIGQLAAPTEEMLQYLKERLQEYPPPPAGSTYERTFTLKGGWRDTPILSGDILGELSNPTFYGPYVMDVGEQAGIHQDRWSTTQDIASEEEATALAFYEDYLKELLSG